VLAGVQRCRAAAAGHTSAGCRVVLRGGVYVLNATLALTPADSGLTIAAFAGETPVITGAVQLPALSWQKVTSTSAEVDDDCTLHSATDATGGQ